MSFKGNKNNHEQWIAFRNGVSEYFELFVNGDSDSVNQKSFEEYLEKGSNHHFHTPIAELSDLKFIMLEKIVNAWFSFSFAFDAFYSERVKRFGHYD